MRRRLVMMIAAAMVISLMAGCGDNDRQNGTQSDSTESQMTDVATDENLANIIRDAGNVGEGTAGSSLRRAKIAHDLAALAAEKGYTEEDIAKLKSTFEATFDAMNEDTKSSARSVFTNSVFPMLDKVINEGNLDEYKGLLEDAGVGGDMDTILKTPGLADSYNSIKSAYLALEDSGN